MVIDADDVFVSSIEGKVLSVTSTTFNEAEYRLRVRVSPTGKMTLLGYRFRSLVHHD